MYRDENVQKVLQRWQLWNELLDDFTEGLEYGVVVDAGQVEAEEGKEKSVKYKNKQSHQISLSANAARLVMSCLLQERMKQCTDLTAPQSYNLDQLTHQIWQLHLRADP